MSPWQAGARCLHSGIKGSANGNGRARSMQRAMPSHERRVPQRPVKACAVRASDKPYGVRRRQYVARPPDRSNTAPVLNEQSSLASQAIIAAISSGMTKRAIGILPSM